MSVKRKYFIFFLLPANAANPVSDVRKFFFMFYCLQQKQFFKQNTTLSSYISTAFTDFQLLLCGLVTVSDDGAQV